MATEFFVSDIHGEYEQFMSNLQSARALADSGAYDKLHVIGDIYDRGPAPDAVIEELMNESALDIQWGNHDIVWMGASLGQRGCVANVVRICARYNNLALLEEAYGIDLSALRTFANDIYGDDPCTLFTPKGANDVPVERRCEIARIQKAIAIMQFKVEYVHSTENPDFNLTRRNLLHHIDFKTGSVRIEGASYPMLDLRFPTIDPTDPYRLTDEEESVMKDLVEAFLGSKRLQRHIALLLDAGSLYTVTRGALLFHAAVPLNADGSLKETLLFGHPLKGRALFDAVDACVRDAFNAHANEQNRKRGRDMLWYLWLGEDSPLFTKSKMATFELYFVEDKAIRKEHKNAYYSLMENERAMTGILREFGLDPAANRIISGHVPVKVKDGESAVKCGGRVLDIDGGMSRAYQATSGIAGFTLIHDAADAAAKQTEATDATGTSTDADGVKSFDREAGTVSATETHAADANAAYAHAGACAAEKPADDWMLIAHQPVGSSLEPEAVHLPKLAPLHETVPANADKQMH